MEGRTFLIQSVYDHRAITAMCRALRKTLRGWRSLALRIFGWSVVILLAVLQLLLALLGAFILDWGEVWIFLVMVAMAAIMLFEDHVTAWLASFNILPGARDSETRFTETEYVCTNEAAVTQFPYENIGTVCELKDYFVFFLGKRHGQIYPKAGFQEGTPEEFRKFITEKTGKEIRFVK